jgi:hypothetical protein
MSIQPIAPPRVSNRAGKKLIALSTPSPRKRQSEPAVDIEDDDWTPISATLTPARAISEFFENDYDVM